MWKFTQHSFAGGVQDTRLIGRQDLDRYWISAKTLDNFMVMRQGCIQKRRGTDYVEEWVLPDMTEKNWKGMCRQYKLLPFTFERDTSYLIAAGSVWKVKNDSVERAGSVSGLGSSSLDYSYIQCGDELILAHSSVPPFRIRRTINTEGGITQKEEFKAETIDFKNLGGAPLPTPPKIYVTQGKNIDANGTATKGEDRTVYYAATAVGLDGRESMPGEAVPMTYQMPWANGFVVKIEIVDEDNNPVGSPDDGVAYYNIYKKTSSGFGLVGSTKGQVVDKQVETEDENGNKVSHTETVYQVTAFQDDYITPNTSITPPVVKDFFTTETEYPSSVALVDQRLIFAATKAAPYTVWWSTVGDLYNFNEHETVRDDDGFSANIPATELPRINHIISMRDMLIFSDGAEWVAEPVSGEALTLKSLSFKQQSHVGCSSTLRPTIIDNKVVFADSTGETIRTIDYSYERDGYVTQNLTILSQHLFDENPVQRWAYQQHPDSTLWCVLKDGSIATLAYMQEHELVAWSRQKLGGNLRAFDICCTKSLRNGCSDLFIMAADIDNKRVVLLRVRDEIETTDTKLAVCLDCMKVEGTPRDLLPGEVAVDVETGRVCTAMRPNRSYCVGFPFEAVFRSISPEARGESTIQFELKDAISAEIRAGNKSKFKLVPTAIEHEPNQTVSAGGGIVADKGVVEFSPADYRVELAGHSGTNGAITLICDDPFPFCLLSYSVNYDLDPQTIGVN